MKFRHGVLVMLRALVVCVLPALLMPSGAGAQSPDPFQRYIVFYNSLPTTIYPVIQAPNKGTSNCGTAINGLMRIVVNKDVENAGIPSGQSVTVAIPKDALCPGGAFYGAVRIYVLNAEFNAFEAVLNPVSQTRRYPGWDYTKYSPCAGCWVGIAGTGDTPPIAGSDYGDDIPGQLLEYTIISQDPATGLDFPNANDSRGRPLLDFDVSYVDYANVPFTMAAGDGGATQFMGSTLGPNDNYNARLTQFLQAGDWSVYGDFAPLNWASSAECPNPKGRPTNTLKTSFSCLVPRTDVVPSAAILISNTRSGGASSFYLAEWDGTTPRQCNIPTANRLCAVALPSVELCCPDVNNVMQGCCDQDHFLIDRSHRSYVSGPVSKPVWKYDNKTLDVLVDRFKGWQGGNNPCTDPESPAVEQAPVIDKPGFCSAYKKTVDFVWKEFSTLCASLRGEAADQCTTTAIIGYDKLSGYNPKDCLKCPNSDPNICPASCVKEAQLNESVQALQRGLPWVASGSPSACTASCPGTSCPGSCVFPATPDPAATIYQLDGFLHFWPPYNSPYSVNPYARFIHNKDGFAAPGAYSFSIDDFYGNFGAFTSTLLVQAGGYDKMPNQEPFNPFKQYHANAGPGWDHVSVCGRSYTPPSSAPNVGPSVPVSFWNNGTQMPNCEVKLFPTADESQYITFLLTEVTYSVTDTYTGLAHAVQGLSGVYAVRFGEPTPPDPYCMQHSTAKQYIDAACLANMSPGFQNLAYVGVSEAACVDKGNDATCGRPLVNLNIPALVKQTQQASQ